MEENSSITLENPPITIGENPPITIEDNQPTRNANSSIRIERIQLEEEKIVWDDEKVNIVVVKEFLEVDESKDNYDDNIAADDSHDVKTENINLFDEATYAIESATQALQQAQEAVIKEKIP